MESHSEAETKDANMEYINSIEAGTFEDRAFGAILGASTADSCGSYIEFQRYVATPEQMEQCMKMPGGGPHQIGPGQITDDSELAMCLMWGLIEANKDKDEAEERVLDTDAIAAYYAKWIQSAPFDIGTTTIGGLRPIAYSKTPQAFIGKKNADKVNQGSISNGSLMRCTPMAIFTSTIEDPKEVFKAVIADVEFTHPNKIVQTSIFVYQSTIHYLLRNPKEEDRAQKAFLLAVELANSDIVNDQDKKEETCKDWLTHASQISELADKEKDDTDFLNVNYNAIKKEGQHKHAIFLSYYMLLRYQALIKSKDENAKAKLDNFYHKAIKESVQLGGDTDTNGCIVGGMMGALLGVKNLDPHMLKQTMSFDCTTQGKRRPEFLSVKKYAINNIQNLIKFRPLKALIIKEFDPQENQQVQK